MDFVRYWGPALNHLEGHARASSNQLSELQGIAAALNEEAVGVVSIRQLDPPHVHTREARRDDIRCAAPRPL